MRKSLQLFLLLFLVPLSCSEKPKEAPASEKKIIIGYVPGFRGVLDELSIDANKLTHINYAFVDVQDSMAWLTNSETRQLVTYDDEESIRLKCEYVLDNGMAGMMFWQYASDPKEYLLDAMNEHLYRKAARQV